MRDLIGKKEKKILEKNGLFGYCFLKTVFYSQKQGENKENRENRLVPSSFCFEKHIKH